MKKYQTQNNTNKKNHALIYYIYKIYFKNKNPKTQVTDNLHPIQLINNTVKLHIYYLENKFNN